MIEFSTNDDDPTSGTRGANSEVGTHLSTMNYARENFDPPPLNFVLSSLDYTPPSFTI